jgi:serine/threonine-protein kinase
LSSNQKLTKCPQCGQSFSSSVKLCPNDGAVLEHSDPTASHIGEVLDGKYRLDSFLSQGGMGAVYKATHVMLGRTVAVKLINPEFVTSTEAVRRFQREARAATSLNHPNIVSVYDLGQTPEGTLYIAMEFVDGPSLKSVISGGGPVPPARTIHLLRQVASALAVAHRHSIVHRDLKPQNIMLTRMENGQEVLKLVDFGIAKTFDDSTQLTVSGSTMGTPQYMSPEQASGQVVDARSDIYSLGVILYEMLSGDVPFNDKSATAIIIKHMKEAPQPPSLRNPRVAIAPALEAATLRCLEKDPAHRFQTAEEFAAALDAAATTIPEVDAAMQATIPVVAPAARPTAMTPPAAVTVKMAADTRPTAAPAPVAPSRVVPAPAVSTPVPRTSGSNIAVVAVMVVLILVAALGGAFYMMRGGNSPQEAATVADPPATPLAESPVQQPPPQAAPASAQSSVGVTAASPPDSASPPARLPGPDGPAAVETSSAPVERKTTVPALVGRGQGRSNLGPPVPTRQLRMNARRGNGAGATATPSPVPPESTSQAPALAFPENPAVFFRCSGAPEICGPLRAAVGEALEAGGLPAVRLPARADVGVAAEVEGLQQTVSQQFQTTFAVRTYSIEVSAETTRTDEAVPMPPPSNLSFDPQFGSARVTERARLVAADIVERVKAFAKRKRNY